MNLVDEIIAAGDDWEDYLYEHNADFLRHTILGKRRWVHRCRQIVAVDGKFYAVEYDAPNTEYQEGSEPHVTAYEVRPVQKTVTDYAPIAKAYV